MKGTKEQKGITLIALIITIVVLLILAAVAISSIQNDGILHYATNAADSWNKAQANEATQLQNYLEYLDKYGNVGETAVAKVGDIVIYDATTDDNGADTAVTTSSTWRLLGVKDGKILITTDTAEVDLPYVECRDVWEDYDSNSEFKLVNDACANYGNGKFAESARCIEKQDLEGIQKDSTTQFLFAEKCFLNNFEKYYAIYEPANDNVEYEHWSVYIMDSDGEIIRHTFFQDWNGPVFVWDTTMGTRPVVTLKSNVKLTSVSANTWKLEYIQ